MKREAKKDNTAGGNLLLCPVPLRNLGAIQKSVVKRMAAGFHIMQHINYSEGTDDLILLDDDGNEMVVNDIVLVRIITRGLTRAKKGYSTTQPDTDTTHHFLKDEYADYVRRHWA